MFLWKLAGQFSRGQEGISKDQLIINIPGNLQLDAGGLQHVLQHRGALHDDLGLQLVRCLGQYNILHLHGDWKKIFFI